MTDLLPHWQAARAIVQGRIEERRAIWRNLVDTKPELAVVQMRIAGHTVSAIAAEVGMPPPAVEQILATNRLLGPWSPKWRDRVKGEPQ